MTSQDWIDTLSELQKIVLHQRIAYISKKGSQRNKHLVKALRDDFAIPDEIYIWEWEKENGGQDADTE